MVPPGLHFLGLRAHARAVNLAVAGISAHHHGEAVFPSQPVHHIRKQERLALLLLDAADVLPAHQRMQLRVFVHRPIDREQQPFLSQRIEMLVQVGVAAP
ncbi:hypothetical protein D3C83_33290 [compost metagenome]